MTARPPKARGARLRDELQARRHRPGQPTDATATEVAHLAVLQAVDHLIAMVILELFATPTVDAQPARRLVSIVRDIQEALVDDLRTGTSGRIDDVWARLNRQEEPA